MDEMELFVMFYTLYTLYLRTLAINLENNGHNNRRWWVRPVNLRRETLGYFTTSFLNIKQNDPQSFFTHTRMNRALYDVLLNLVEGELTKHSMRKPVEFECRLAVTLSYLSQGVSHQFLAWSFQLGKSTVREIILDTCKVLWKVLSPIYVAPPNHEDLKNIAKDFWTQWNMPHCLGAIDGKYINIQCPPNSGSQYYDHKGRFSIVLLGTCDANLCFTYVDVGGYGSQSDSGILASTKFGKSLVQKRLPVPSVNVLPNSRKPFPYYFIGDSAFPLKENIMRPYPGYILNVNKKIFNYRLCRARRVIENAFGVLVARWRILLTTINALPENAETIVLATIALHNFIKLSTLGNSMYCPNTYIDREDEEGVVIPGEWRNDVGQQARVRMRWGSNNATQRAFHLRDTLAEYFLSEGSVPFQFNKI